MPDEFTNEQAIEEKEPVVEAQVVEAPEESDDQQVPDPADLGVELPAGPEAAVDTLLIELARAREEATAYLDDLRRVAADFDNFRKRMLRDQAANIERASERVVRSLLPVLDSFDAALAIEAETPAEQKMLQGIRGTYNLLLDTLAREGLEVIHAAGEDFDPEIHEAVQAPTGDEAAVGALLVTDELRRGYRLRGRVLRAPLVAVGYQDGGGES